MQDVKTFNLLAITKKGNYPVEIKVWRELASGQSFANKLFWRNTTTVNIQGKKFEATYLPYMGCIQSLTIATHFNIAGNVKLRVENIDSIKKYKKEIEAIEEREWADFYEEEEEKKKYFDL